MSIEGIQQQNPAAGFTPEASKTSGSGHAESIFLGHAVSTVESPASLLADAAEELGFCVDRTKDYEISQRKERETSEIGKRLLEAYRAQMEKIGGAERQSAMRDLVERLKHAAERNEMKRLVEEAFSDPTEAWAALESAMEAFAEDPAVDGHQRLELRALRDAFVDENARAIRLGIPGTLACGEYPETGGPDASRELYRRTVGQFSGVQEVYRDIRAKFGDRFEKAMDFLFEAIRIDLADDSPSMERAHLESVHVKLGLVRLADSAYKTCVELANRWKSISGTDAPGLEPSALLGDVLQLCEHNYVSTLRLNAILQKSNAADPEQEVLFAQELLAAVRRLPPALFEGEKGLLSVTEAVQKAVDEAVAREDAWLAAQED